MMNDEKTVSAELTGQTIPDVQGTEPRLSARERVVKAATHAYVHGKTSPLVDYVYLAAAREAILVAKERLQRAYDERLTTRRLIPHDEYLEGSADGRGHQLAIIEALIIEIGSGIQPSSAKRSDGTRRSEAR